MPPGFPELFLGLWSWPAVSEAKATEIFVLFAHPGYFSCILLAVKGKRQILWKTWVTQNIRVRRLLVSYTLIGSKAQLRKGFSQMNAQFGYSNPLQESNCLQQAGFMMCLPVSSWCKSFSNLLPERSPRGHPQLALIINPYSSHSFHLPPPS